MARERNRGTLEVVCLNPRETQSVTSLMLKRELENVRRELRNLKTGQHENKERKRGRRNDSRRQNKLYISNMQQSRTVNEVQKSRSCLVLDHVERRLREPYIEREQFEDLELSLKVLPFQCIVTKKSACAKLYTVQQEDLKKCQQE